MNSALERRDKEGFSASWGFARQPVEVKAFPKEETAWEKTVAGSSLGVQERTSSVLLLGTEEAGR